MRELFSAAVRDFIAVGISAFLMIWSAELAWEWIIVLPRWNAATQFVFYLTIPVVCLNVKRLAEVQIVVQQLVNLRLARFEFK